MSATALCLVCMIPPVLLGGAAKTLSAEGSVFANDTSIVLPAMIQEETPRWAAMICLAAIRSASTRP